MENIVKVTGIHIIFSLIASVLSVAISIGLLGDNKTVIDILPGIVAIIFIYLAGQICQRLYKDDVKGFSAWFMDGILPFLFAWFISFILLFNYLK